MNIPKLRFPGFSSPWEFRNLHEFVVDMVGGAPLIPEEILDQGDYKIIPKKAIQAGGKIHIDDDCNYVTSSVFKQYSANRVDKSYIIVVLRDLVPSGPNIGYAVENDKVDEGVLAQGVYGIHLNKMMNAKYFIQFTNTPKYRTLMHKIMVGSTQVYIRNSTYINIGVSYTSLEEQQKIADFLSSVDEVISTSEQEVANLETQKKAVMKKIFSQEVRFKNADGIDYPEWEEDTLGNHCIFYNGDRGKNYPSTSDYVAEGIPFINAGDLDGKRISEKCAKISEKKYNQLGGAKLARNDILYCLRGSLGKMGIVDFDTGGTVASSLVAIRAKDVDYLYMYYFLGSPLEYEQRKVNDEGLAQPNLSAKNVGGYIMPIPCLEEQRLIAGFLFDFDEAIAAAKKELELWKELKKGLLQQMFV